MGWHKVSRHPAPRAWVVRTALNTGASWWRRRRKETPVTDYDLEASEDEADGLDGALPTALRRLPVQQREVIVLRVFLDLDIDTTASLLGIAPGTVRAHLSRAMTALSGQLAPATITEVER
jgi:RNA polymerase sigma factor (sigma-70 family)